MYDQWSGWWFQTVFSQMISTDVDIVQGGWALRLIPPTPLRSGFAIYCFITRHMFMGKQTSCNLLALFAGHWQMLGKQKRFSQPIQKPCYYHIPLGKPPRCSSMFVDIFFDFSSPFEFRQLTTILHNFTTISSPFYHHFTIIVPPMFSIFPHISAQETSAPSSKFQRNPRSPPVRTALRPQQPPGAAAPGGHHWHQALPVASAGDEVLHVRCGGGLCFEVLPVTWMKTWEDLADTCW